MSHPVDEENHKLRMLPQIVRVWTPRARDGHGSACGGVRDLQAITRALSLAEAACVGWPFADLHNAHGRIVHTDEVGGSSPLPPTSLGFAARCAGTCLERGWASLPDPWHRRQ